MARVTKQRLQNLIERINSRCGFKGYKTKRLKNGKLGEKDSGFLLASAYNKYSIEFRSKKRSAKVSNSMSAPEMEEYLQGMTNGIDWYKKRATVR